VLLMQKKSLPSLFIIAHGGTIKSFPLLQLHEQNRTLLLQYEVAIIKWKEIVFFCISSIFSYIKSFTGSVVFCNSKIRTVVISSLTDGDSLDSKR
jgi:hypothetical protein